MKKKWKNLNRMEDIIKNKFLGSQEGCSEENKNRFFRNEEFFITLKRLFSRKKKLYLSDSFCDWFAVDSEGFVAYFHTSDGGAAPKSFFKIALDEYLDVQNYLHGEPIIETAADLFEGYAEFGMFYYDESEDDWSVYGRLCVPSTPKYYTEFPLETQKALIATRFEGRFSEVERFDVPCLMEKGLLM